MDIDILVPMTERQIKILKYCQKYYDKIEYITENGGFDVVNGHCEIHYDKENRISDVVNVEHHRSTNCA